MTVRGAPAADDDHARRVRLLLVSKELAWRTGSTVRSQLTRTKSEKTHPGGRNQAVKQNTAELMELATIHFDGGGQSPGPVTAACTVELSDGSFDQDVERFDQGTHNTAGWQAMILGLRMALKHGERHVVAKGDSMLVVKQINREWKQRMRLCRLCGRRQRSCWRSSRLGASSGFRAGADGVQDQRRTKCRSKLS